MAIWETPEQPTLSGYFVKIKSISVDADSVTRVGSFISCLSPYKSEFSNKRRVFTSGVEEAKLQFKSPNR